LPTDLVLRNAKIFASGKMVEAGLAIEGGRIAKIAKEPNLPSASEKMNLDGLLVLPGLIDAHVHLRDQELGYKEGFFSGTAAAANGGVTLVIDMPNNKPVTMSLGTLKERMKLAAEKAVVNVAFYSAPPKKIGEMPGIVQGGVKAFKLFMAQKVGGLDPNDDEALLEAFRETARLNVPMAVHAEDESLIESASMAMKKKETNCAEAYLKGRPPKAEVKAVDRIIKIAEKSKAHTHICHVSTARGIGLIASAKSAGLPITCEVTPHHLLLSSRHAKKMGAVALSNPPLRSSRDVSALWSALDRGLIDILASDHAPHAIEEKEKASVWEAAPGISGVETLLPLMLTQVSKGRLSLSRLVQMASEMPAQVFGIKDRGGLREGNYADLVVVDLHAEWRIDASRFHSKAKYSPFDGWRVRGKPVKTLVNGRLVMEDGEILAEPGDGCVVK
jgi:dihydroorotase (multifunctional complex type)